MISRIYAMAATLLLPAVSLAQDFKPVNKLTDGFADLISTVIPLILALALLFFFWTLIQFIRNLDKGDASTAEGARKLIWGVIVLFVMVSIWGIISYMQKKLGIRGGGSMDAPAVNIPRSSIDDLTL